MRVSLRNLSGDPFVWTPRTIHMYTEVHGYAYYEVVVTNGPGGLGKGQLWLRVQDVVGAEAKDADPTIVSRLRQDLWLNIANALHWNPLPGGQILDWDKDVTLMRLGLPTE